MRDLKFRAWDGNKMLNPIKITDLAKRPAISENIVNSLIFEQYTGLKDKNGLEIYEGDIIKIHKDDKYVSRGLGRTAKKVPVYRDYVVQYNQEKMSFEFKCLSDEPNYLETGTNKKKVIGNIHQNPELLK